jgi:hypothetical protein
MKINLLFIYSNTYFLVKSAGTEKNFPEFKYASHYVSHIRMAAFCKTRWHGNVNPVWSGLQTSYVSMPNFIQNSELFVFNTFSGFLGKNLTLQRTE